MNKIIIDSDKVKSSRFDDVYFSGDGIAETDYVFLQGNNLQERFCNNYAFTVAETGFGTGLNFFSCCDLWNKYSGKGTLNYISVEKFLVPKDILKVIHGNWPQFETSSKTLLNNYSEKRGVYDITFNNVILTLVVGDVLELNKLEFLADAWFLDGFAPAKNSEMWSESVFDIIATHTNVNGTVATFSCAKVVRDGLKKSGFQVEKISGFGNKRHMLRGSR